MEKNSPMATAKKKQAMIEALEANLGNITKAAKQAGITAKTHYRWLKEDNAYNIEVYRARGIGHGMVKDTLLDAALNRIKEGDSTVLNQLLRIYLKKLPEEIDMISKTLNPSTLRATIKYAPHPADFMSKDPASQAAVKQYMEERDKQR